MNKGWKTRNCVDQQFWDILACHTHMFSNTLLSTDMPVYSIHVDHTFHFTVQNALFPAFFYHLPLQLRHTLMRDGLIWYPLKIFFLLSPWHPSWYFVGSAALAAGDISVFALALSAVLVQFPIWSVPFFLFCHRWDSCHSFLRNFICRSVFVPTIKIAVWIPRILCRFRSAVFHLKIKHLLVYHE